MRLAELIDGLKISASNVEPDFEVRFITLDSRRLVDSSLFFAIKGEKSDGLNFIADAIARDSVVVMDREVPEILKNRRYIRVEDIVGIMNTVADRFYHSPYKDMKMIGVTGTNGKSSVTYLIESILNAANIDAGVIGTVNYRYKDRVIPAVNTTPDPLLLMEILSDMRGAGISVVAMEVSSHGLYLRRTAALKFDTVIFTNLSRDHLDFHGDMESYFNAKRLLFRKDYLKGESSSALINEDNEYGRRLMTSDLPVIRTYSCKNSKAFVFALRYSLGAESLNATLVIDGHTIEIESRLLGLHNLYNIMAAAGAGYLVGVKLQDIREGIRSLQSIPGRLQRVENVFGIRCLVDYAHSEDSLRNVLNSLRQIPHNRLITVFGAGGDRDRGKRPLMASTVSLYSDIIIITSDNPRTERPESIIEDIERGIPETFRKVDLSSSLELQEKVYTVIVDRSEAIRMAVMIARRGDIVLIAGKGHEDYIIEGTTKRYFSDVEEAEMAFFQKGKG